MTTTTVTELKASLSRYVRLVKAGEDVLVTERGLPVARLSPVPGLEGLPARVEELVRLGLVRPGTGRLPRDFWKSPAPKDPKGRLLRALLEEREESL